MKALLRLFTLITFGIIIGCKCYGQPYTFIKYGKEYGFTASMAYCLHQDEKGYIWIGTEKGLMRFNGYDFKVYTVHDGLPDNEILAVRRDKKDRLWLLPYATSICYMKNGKIFNQENDPILKRLQFASRPYAICFDSLGNTWIHDRESLTGILADGSIKSIKGFGVNKDKIADFWIDSTGKLMVVTYAAICFQWNGQEFSQKDYIPFKPGYGCYFDASIFYNVNKLWYHTSKEQRIEISKGFAMPAIDNQSGCYRLSVEELAIFSTHGIYFLNSHSRKITDSFLTHYRVGAILKAKDSSLWFGTTKGLFRAIRTPIKTVMFPHKPSSVTFIKAGKSGMYGTTSTAEFIEAKLGKKGIYQATQTILDKEDPSAYYVFAIQNLYKKWITISSAKIRLQPRIGDNYVKRYFDVCKFVIREDSNHLLLASKYGVCRFNMTQFKIVDTFPIRSVMVLEKMGGIIYAGTLNGLIACSPDKRYYQILPGSSLLQKNITALCTGKNDMLWCANNKATLIGLKNDKIVTVVDLKKGLQCNRIFFLKASDEFIWVATDNGLFVITQTAPYNIVRHFTYATGLNSNQVNCVGIYQKRIWIGTASGINYLDEGDIFLKRDNTKIIINRITNGDKLLETSKEVLQLQDKQLAIDFDVIDFFGGTSPVFEYSLNEGTDWIPLEGKHLYFPTLPYGTFTLRIKAFSPNWAGGAIFQQTFYNPMSFYKRLWFIVLVTITGLSMLLMIIFFFVKKVRRRDQQRLNIERNLLRLEQTALQGQMNPHFIFNCIAAIKQYYNAGDISKANSFVDSFASLIRQTFELGTETFVPLDKELGYLIQYMDVEKARFNDSFCYYIKKQTKLPDSVIFVPAMLVQPIVENAIRHGVRHLMDKKGEVYISVVQIDDQIEFTIKDNGIGREKNMALKGRITLNELNSGMVNEKRIHILNRLFSGSVKMQVEDLYDKEGTANGTKVIISFPVNLNQFLKDERNNN